MAAARSCIDEALPARHPRPQKVTSVARTVVSGGEVPLPPGRPMHLYVRGRGRKAAEELWERRPPLRGWDRREYVGGPR
jgi:hypothetical protein